ncbi:MAG TPA: hypothetical protein PLL36_02155 [Candidatus Hydrogenedentes bacterium]|jgi:hypothetical protein|nr:MAG: hypothetical protein BWX80_01459 [Candidatus Hydrogenedentes bacterium ADurb.Bin101]HOC70240.1 hypothetical protein [Candidatus Hydrogenedentota bacterium]HQM99844.1 hypothetical protein [Candidatus Hydrogenedentota bacterium]
MTYKGHVQNGAIVLDEPTRLPEGAPVKIELVLEDENNAPSFGERYAEVFGKASSLPEDAAENHDHYLYGVEKQ